MMEVRQVTTLCQTRKLDFDGSGLETLGGAMGAAGLQKPTGTGCNRLLSVARLFSVVLE